VEQGYFQLCIALYRPDIPSHVASNNGLVSPPQSTSEPDLIRGLQQLSISQSQSTIPALNDGGSMMSTPVRSSALQMHPSYGYMPILYQSVPPYVLDNLPPQSHSGGFPSATLPYINPMAPRSAYIPRDMIVPRGFPPLNRRQNATRISRSPYYQRADQHNFVNIDHIKEGTDVRTTVSSFMKTMNRAGLIFNRSCCGIYLIKLTKHI
jgi:hypothetical protein